MAITLSIDDGCASDVRVAELCKKYNIECTFYWPIEHRSVAYNNGYKPLSYVNQVEISKYFEIGSHTLTHRHLTKISFAEAREEIENSKHMLEKLFDKKITKFAPPRGYTNAELTDFTLQHYTNQRLTKGAGLVHLHPNSGVNGNIDWQTYYEQEKSTNIELWGHSHEWDRFDMWQEVESFLSEVRT